MKRDKNISCLVSAAVALVLSYGMAGSLITGFDMNMDSMGRLLGVCALASAVSALCFRFRRGGTVLLCLLVPVSWYVFRQEQLIPQALYMLYSILRRFQSAYGWPLPGFISHRIAQSVIWPVGILSAVAAMAASRAACRARGVGIALVTAAVPFFLCFVVTDTVPDTAYLFLWLLGVVTLILPQSIRREDTAQGATLTVMTAAAASAALALLFFLVPRDGYDKQPAELQQRIVNWVQEMPQMLEEMSENVSSAVSGSVQPSEVSLKNLGPRAKNNYPVMEVTAPRSGVLYLRGQDYDLYDGTGWTANRHRTEQFSSEGMENVGEISVRTRRTRDVLYLPYYPGDGITLIGGRMDNGENLKEYSFYQWVLPENLRGQDVQTQSGMAHSLILSGPELGDPSEARRYRNLPNGTEKWAKEKLAEILDDQHTAADKAEAIARYVKNTAPYDRNTQRMPAGQEDFVQWFLEEGETGYCVHFATAAVVLLRAAGIEARYVEGYMTLVSAGVSETVTEDQAHAWAEYYDPAVDNWVVLEATPADLTEDMPQSQPPVWQPLTQPAGEGEQDDASTQPQASTEPAPVISGLVDNGKTPNLTGLWKWLVWIGALCLTAAAVIGQRKARLTLRVYRQNRGSANERALARWRELELLYRLLREAPPEDMEALARKAKYSQHRLSPEELDIMDKQICIARQRLDGQNFIQRLLYRYLFAAY